MWRNPIIKLIMGIVGFFWDKIEPLTARDDYIGTLANFVVSIAFFVLTMYIFFSIVTAFDSYIGKVIIELTEYLILIFIFGYLTLAALPPGLNINDDDIPMKDYYKDTPNLPFKRIKDKISMICLESFTSSWFRTAISLYFFGLMIYFIINLTGWMYMGFEITETTHTREYPEQEYYRR